MSVNGKSFKCVPIKYEQTALQLEFKDLLLPDLNIIHEHFLQIKNLPLHAIHKR